MRTFFEHEGAVQDVAFSSDGTCVVSCGDDGKINVWDARSHGLLQHYASHAGPVTAIAMEPRSGHYLASSGSTSPEFRAPFFLVSWERGVFL